MITYLQSKGIQVKPAGTESVANCVFCKETGGHLYINQDKGVFFCHKCGEAGNIWKLKKHFGDLVEPVKMYKDKFKTPEIGLDDKYFEQMKVSKDAVKWLIETRGFLKDTIRHFKIGYKDGYIAFPYYRDGKLVNFKYRSIIGKEFTREKGCESTLYNMDGIDRTKDIIITEGECDAIAAWQMGFKNVVSVSIGAGSVNDSWHDYFENCSASIYIAYDNDQKGEEGARKLASSIGLARCYRVRLPFKDFNECMMSGVKKEEIEQLIKSAESYRPSRIKHATHIISELEDQMRSGEKCKGVQLKGELEIVNEYLGGWRPCEVTILTGDTASGKSTFAINVFTEFLSLDKSVIILSSEMRATKVMSKMFSMHIGKSIGDFSDEDMKTAISYFSKKNLFFIDVHGELSTKEMIECLEYSKAKYNIEFALIDHLHFLIDRSKDNQVQAIELFMRDIVDVTHRLMLHTILIAHPSKLNNNSGAVDMNDLKGASAIKQDADNVMIVFRDRKKEDMGVNQIVLDIQKVRDDSGPGGKKRFDFNITSQRYTEAAINDTGIERPKVPRMQSRGIYGKNENY